MYKGQSARFASGILAATAALEAGGSTPSWQQHAATNKQTLMSPSSKKVAVTDIKVSTDPV